MNLGPLHEFLRSRRTALLALLLMCCIYFFSYFQRLAIPGTIFDELQNEFAASAAAIAALSSIFLYIYGGVQIGIGLAADRWGGARLLLISGLLMSIGSVWFPLCHSIPELYASRVLVGLGASGIYIAIVKEIDRLFDASHFAIMLCLALFIGYSGGLAGTFPLERLVAWLGWRPALLIAGGLCTAVFLTASIMLKRIGNPRATGPAPKAKLYFRDILLNWNSYPVAFSGSVNFSIYFIWQAIFGKKMLTDACGLSSAGAASVIFFMMLINLGFITASGFVSRLMGNRRKPIMLASVFLTLAAIAMMTGSLAFRAPDARWITAGCLVLGLASSGAVMFSCTMKELNPERAAGTSIGFINSYCYLFVAVTAQGAGVLMDHFRNQAVSTASALIYPAAAYRAILVLCLILAVISVVSAFFIRESRGVCIYEDVKARV